jgi:uncharacterized protein YjiS (DUF1127 family)
MFRVSQDPKGSDSAAATPAGTTRPPLQGTTAMASFDDTRHALATGHFFPFAANVFHRAIDVVVAYRNRRQVARLLSWDAHMLRDIGLTPGDVSSALASPLAEDPSCRLDALARERRRAVEAGARERRDRGRR